MKVYVTGDDRVVVAVSETGEKLGLVEVNDFGTFESAVHNMRDYVLSVRPEASVLFVPDPGAHPIVRELLSLKTEDSNDKTPKDQGSNHLCTTCVHSPVCRGAAVALELNASIGACPHNKPTPEGEP